MAQGIPMNYGTCEGGPWNKKQMAHPETLYRVAVDTDTRRAMPAFQASPHANVKFGCYRFYGGKWVWEGFGVKPKTDPEPKPGT